MLSIATPPAPTGRTVAVSLSLLLDGGDEVAPSTDDDVLALPTLLVPPVAVQLADQPLEVHDAASVRVERGT